MEKTYGYKQRPVLKQRYSRGIPQLTIIIPAYNEEHRIARTLEDYCSFFSSKDAPQTKIHVVINGSTDKTAEVVNQLAKKYKNLSCTNIPEAIGKGGALIFGFQHASSPLVGFADADGATKAKHFAALLPHMKEADAAIASRWLPESIVRPKQPFARRFASRVFNILIRTLFQLPLADTQCGCKLFKRDALKKVLPSLKTTRWAFDVDLLYQLKRNHARIREIPTVWEDIAGSKLRIPKVSFQMFLAIMRLRVIYSPLKFVVPLYNKLADQLKWKTKRF